MARRGVAKRESGLSDGWKAAIVIIGAIAVIALVIAYMNYQNGSRYGPNCQGPGCIQPYPGFTYHPSNECYWTFYICAQECGNDVSCIQGCARDVCGSTFPIEE